MDLTVLTGFGGEATVIDELLGQLSPRLDDARAFALHTRVLLLHASNGTPLDISLGAMPFESRAVGRSSAWAVGSGTRLTTCGAEDLIVLKAFADRPQDWLDIETILKRQRPRLDVDLIRNELAPLIKLKEAPEILSRLDRLMAHTSE